MANLFFNAKPGDKFICRDGSKVTYVGIDTPFYMVNDGECDYTVHEDGMFLHGTDNGEPTISDCDVIYKIE